MTPESYRSLHEELGAHAGWVRKLARSLVRDEATADDLGQEAALAALRHGEERPERLRPWLASVTRNFARRGWREAARRAARERQSARPEAQPGADEAAARLEIQRRLVDELAALEPAVRNALVRRYFDGWSSARIARASGEPAATVRWRLQRGLAELRVRLDRKSGGDGLQWRLALLPVCSGASPWGGLADHLGPWVRAGAIPGALTMKAASQVLAAGALATALGLGVWWSLGRDEEPRVAASTALEEPTVELETPAPVAQPLAEPAEPAREPVAAVPAPASEPVVAAVAELAAAPRVTGRCVDERLVPIDGARVSQVGAEASARTRSDGSFELETGPHGAFGNATLLFEARGRASRFVELALPASGSVLMGDVVLAPGGRVRGRVRAVSGAAVAGASVSVTSPDLLGTLEQARVEGPRGNEVLVTVSDADGRFDLDGVGVGPVRVWAVAEGTRYAVSAPVEVRAHEASEEIELVLEPIRTEDRVTGIVRTPAGAPVPGARIEIWERIGGGGTTLSEMTGADGRFSIAAKEKHLYDLTALDPEDRWTGVLVKGLPPGTHDLELRFAEARWIDVSAHTPDGEPVESYLVQAENEDGMLELARAAAGSGGEARLRAAGVPFTVALEARGYARVEKGPYEPGEEPATLAFELEPMAGVRGRVLADGRPVSGARVTLHRYEARSQIEHQGYACLTAPRPSDETTTDAEGRFSLYLRQSATCSVRAVAEGFAPSESPRFELVPRVGREGVELVLGPGGVLEGRVLVAPGRDPSGVIVAVNRGDGQPRSMRSGVDGAFRFEGLTAGPWHLLRGPQDVNPKGGGTSFSSAKTPVVIPFNCTIRDGETTYQDLDLRDFEPCVVNGRLLVNGAPARDWGVQGWPGAKQAMVGTPPSTATAADGSFTLSIDDAGPLRLSFSPPAEIGGSGRIDVLLEAVPGANEWSADLTLGRLTGRCLTPPEPEAQLFYVVSERSPSCWLEIQPDASGRFTLPFVPAGQGTVRRWTNDRWETLAEADVPAGGERALDVP